MIEILHPGLFTTVQDLGRHGYAHLGVSPAGAADPLAVRIGNLLTGNDEGAPALEMTLLGARCRFGRECTIALTGADCGARLNDVPLPPWRSVAVQPGQMLAIGSAEAGARAYLCISGGVQVPAVLGSASTHILSGLGGYEGRALRRGDRLAYTPGIRPTRVLAERWRAALQPRRTLRVTAGVQCSFFPGDAVFRLFSSPYRVRDESNRMGLRLSGPALYHSVPEMPSEGMPIGALQVPPSGEPILLFVDAQTTGGYPVIACVISADLPSAGQLRPRDEVRFEAVSWEQADPLLREQEAMLDAIRRELA